MNAQCTLNFKVFVNVFICWHSLVIFVIHVGLFVENLIFLKLFFDDFFSACFSYCSLHESARVSLRLVISDDTCYNICNKWFRNSRCITALLDFVILLFSYNITQLNIVVVVVQNDHSQEPRRECAMTSQMLCYIYTSETFSKWTFNIARTLLILNNKYKQDLLGLVRFVTRSGTSDRNCTKLKRP